YAVPLCTKEQRGACYVTSLTRIVFTRIDQHFAHSRARGNPGLLLWALGPRLRGDERNTGDANSTNEDLERQQHVEHLLAVARLLDVGDLAAAAIGDARLGDLGGFDGVVALDVLRANDAGDDELAHFEVDADL